MNKTRRDIGELGEQPITNSGAEAVKAGARIAMLLENNPYPGDVRVRSEAESLVAAGYRVSVTAPRASGQPRSEEIAGVEVHRFRLLQTGGGGALSFALEYLVAFAALNLAALRELARGARVLHLHNPPDILFTAAIAARALGRRVVFDSHDLFPELVAAKFGSGPWERLARACERATFALADHVVAANESHAEVARERGRKAPGAVTVVRNGVPGRLIAGSAALRPGPLSDPLLVYVGAISGQDGAEGLAAAMRQLVERHGLNGARLRIVGDGDRRDAVESAMAAHSVADRVEITGWVDAERVPGLIADADICVDPAPPTELNQRSTMIKIGEYMAAGKPVVAYDLLETRRTLDGGGTLVATSDNADPDGLAAAIASLAADGERRADLAERGLIRARELTWERSEDALLGVYRGLVQ